MNRSTTLNRMLISCALLGLAAAAGANPPDNPGQSKAAEYASVAFDRDAALAERAATHAWLVSEAVQRGRGAWITAEPTDDEKAAIDNAARGTTPERVGLAKPLAVNVSFSDVSPGQLKGRALARSHGAMAGTVDGGYVYTATLGSAGATALRVHFTGFRLPDNAGLYLYTENGQVFGPYTGRGIHGDGEFWSHTLMGDTVYLQVRHAGPASAADLNGTGFTIAGLGHVRPRWLGFCSGNASCVENVNCVTGDPEYNASAVNDARNAVAHMQWISGPYIYICSGGLVADTAPGEIPYFLSANHCISRGKDARSLENFFQFAAPCGTSGNCDNVIATRNNHLPGLRTLGASIVSTDKATDHTLFELKQDAPTGSAFLGWTSTPVANTNGANLYRISHPGGAPQAYSKHTVDTSATTCLSWPRGDRIYSRDTFGATEGGSSGSPVVNATGQIVGQLSGACGYNVNDSCDSTSNATVDGAFAAYFDSVAPFLQNGGSCTATEPAGETSCSDGIDNDCDGLIDGADSDCGGGQCTVTEVTELSCSDGIDNDCDGFPDGDDSDCDSGGTLLPVGAPCTADGQCLTGKCKGRSGAKTCK